MTNEFDADIQELMKNVPSAPQVKDLPKEDQEKLAKLESKIPGLDLTYGDAEQLMLSEEDIKNIQETKKQYEVPLHLVRTYRAAYLVRECARIEWRNKMMEWQGALAQARDQMLAENRDQAAIQNVLDMLLQERVVAWLLVHPKIDQMALRRFPPGEVETLYGAILQAQGFGQQVLPLKI
jgi:hypothetical protein